MARILLLCWRDDAHPQAGGSERYLHQVGMHLAARGHTVFYRTSRPDGAARAETSGGVRISRGGGRFTVYPRALAAIVAARSGRGPLAELGRADVVIDTQNGVPFFARLVSGAPGIVLVHHVHREQWPVAGRWTGRLGWWIESWLAPRVHAHDQYVTVSIPSAEELASLGVDRERIAVIRNGLDPVPPGIPAGAPQEAMTARSTATRDLGARLVVLSRLVPHKHVEDTFTVLAALRENYPDLTLDVIGDGWWAGELRTAVRERGLAGAVRFHGHVDEVRKHELLSAAHVHLMPSRKEGWGLAVMEAAQHGVPTIGYHNAVGLRDSVVDGETGLLTRDIVGLTDATVRLLDEPDLRERLGAAARERAAGFSWQSTGARMENLITAVMRGERLSGEVDGTTG